MADPVQGEGKQSSCTALSGEGRHSHQVQRLATNSLSLLNLISACRVLEVPPQPGAQPHKGSSCSAWNATPGAQGPSVPSSSCCSSGRQQLCSARPSPLLPSARQVPVLLPRGRKTMALTPGWPTLSSVEAVRLGQSHGVPNMEHWC